MRLITVIGCVVGGGLILGGTVAKDSALVTDSDLQAVEYTLPTITEDFTTQEAGGVWLLQAAPNTVQNTLEVQGQRDLLR